MCNIVYHSLRHLCGASTEYVLPPPPHRGWAEGNHSRGCPPGMVPLEASERVLQYVRATYDHIFLRRDQINLKQSRRCVDSDFASVRRRHGAFHATSVSTYLLKLSKVTFEFAKHFMVLNRWVCAGEMWTCSRSLVGGLKVTDQVLHFSIMINLFDLPNSMKLMGGEGYLQVSR